MSKMSIPHTMLRIRDADPSSKIAVFTTNDPFIVNAVFAATIATQNQISGVAPASGLYIGSFDRNSEPNATRLLIEEMAAKATA